MTQLRFTDFRAPVESFPLGLKNIGLIKPGRFNGYDLISQVSGLNVQITHRDLTRRTLKNGNASNSFGALIMPNGTIVHDTNSLALVIDSNVGNLNDRIDFLIAEHDYAETIGGVPITYTILKGPANGDGPVLTDPTKQVLIGVFNLTANSNSYTDLTYEPILAPLPGDMTPLNVYSLISEYIENLLAEEGGEANTANNAGDGTGVFKTKQGVTLQLRSFKSTDGSVSFEVTQDGNGIDVKAVGANNVVNITSSTILNNNDHNNKTLRCINSENIILTIPEGLAAGFSCSIFQDLPTAQNDTGLAAFGLTANKVSIVTSGAVKARSYQGYNRLRGLGFTAFIQGTSITNYYVLMGDLILNS